MQAKPPQAGGPGDQSAEIARLRREVERLRMEQDILKKLSPSCLLTPPSATPSTSSVISRRTLRTSGRLPLLNGASQPASPEHAQPALLSTSVS